MKSEIISIDRDCAAHLIRYVSTTKRISQGEIARSIGIHRPLLSEYLARRIDLLPNDINSILATLGLRFEVQAEKEQTE